MVNITSKVAFVKASWVSTVILPAKSGCSTKHFALLPASIVTGGNKPSKPRS